MDSATTNFRQVSVTNNAGKSIFTLPKRYTNIRFLSAGAQGIVMLVVFTNIITIITIIINIIHKYRYTKNF